MRQPSGSTPDGLERSDNATLDEGGIFVWMLSSAALSQSRRLDRRGGSRPDPLGSPARSHPPVAATPCYLDGAFATLYLMAARLRAGGRARGAAERLKASGVPGPGPREPRRGGTELVSTAAAVGAAVSLVDSPNGPPGTALRMIQAVLRWRTRGAARGRPVEFAHWLEEDLAPRADNIFALGGRRGRRASDTTRPPTPPRRSSPRQALTQDRVALDQTAVSSMANTGARSPSSVLTRPRTS